MAVAESPAQVPTALLRPGDTLDWQGQSHTVSRTLESKFNQYGCRGTAVELVSPSGNFEAVYWGSCQGEAPRILRGAQTIGTIEQSSIDTVNWGFNEAGDAVYHARITAGGSSVWVGDTLIVKAGDPLPGTTNRFFTNPGSFGVLATTGGGPVFVSNVRNGAGNNARAGLFQGSPPVALLRAGDSIPGLSGPLWTLPIPPSWIRRFVNVSPDGSHWCAAVELSSEAALVVDGQAAMVNGLPVETGAPVPATIASQATWSSINDVSVNDQGSWTALLSYVLPAGNVVDTVFRDGVPIVQQGATIGALGVIASIDRLHTSRNGRLAFIARDSTFDQHLVVDRRVVLSVGVDIDYTGDGVVDPGFRLNRIGSFSAGTELPANSSGFFIASTAIPGPSRPGSATPTRQRRPTSRMPFK